MFGRDYPRLKDKLVKYLGALEFSAGEVNDVSKVLINKKKMLNDLERKLTKTEEIKALEL